MAYSEKTGFEGLYLDLIERRLLGFNPEKIGFEGLYLDLIERRLLGFNPEKIGFEGIILSVLDTDRFLKITDFRGNPVNGAVVTVQNTGGDFTTISDSTGFAMVQVDIAGTKTIRLQKNKTSASFTYTYASESLTRTVVFMPRLLE